MALGEKKISQLTPLPDNLSLAALLAVVQGGTTQKTDFQKVLDLIAGNISTISLPTETAVPVIIAESGSPTIVYGTQVARWQRVGKQVHLQVFLSLTSVNGGSGYAAIQVPGLPAPLAAPSGGGQHLYSAQTGFPTAGDWQARINNSTGLIALTPRQSGPWMSLDQLATGGSIYINSTYIAQ